MISLLAYIYLFKQAPIISELSYKDIVYKRLVEDVDYNNGYYGERTPDFVLRRLWFAKYRLKKNENSLLKLRKQKRIFTILTK